MPSGRLSTVFREDLNFLLTNRIPRAFATRLMGRISRIEQPLFVALALKVWQWFTPLDLGEAREAGFRSIHACFTRSLRDGARPVDADPAVLASPCDAIVGAFGTIAGTEVIQAKGYPYSLAELLGDAALADPVRDGVFVTLRITAGMYHRFHAPDDLRLEEAIYHSGDTWNVNPIALARVERLFCRNERAVLRCTLRSDARPLLLVPVAAILVAGIRLHCADVVMNLRYRGANRIPCGADVARGEEMGWFEHGSTIIVLAPAGFAPVGGLREGAVIRAGQALLRRA